METKKKDDRKLLGRQIEDRILEYIKEKPLEVGDRLPNEFELAEMFEVGRSTIREAVKGLVTKGVLQVRRGAGTYVSSLTPAEDDPLRLNAKLHDRFKLALDLFDAIHTLDRPSLAQKLARAVQARGASPQLFVQVNTGAEPQKAGILPDDADGFIAECRGLDLPLVGLMCIPPEGQDPVPHFRELRGIAARNGLRGLSMGMSADFERAIAEGATHIRVGSAIFGERHKL